MLMVRGEKQELRLRFIRCNEERNPAPHLSLLTSCFSFGGPGAVAAAIAAAITATQVVLLREDHVAFRGEVKIAGLEGLGSEIGHGGHKWACKIRRPWKKLVNHLFLVSFF